MQHCKYGGELQADWPQCFVSLIGYYSGTMSGGERGVSAMLTVLLAGVDIRNYMVDTANRVTIHGV